MGYTLKTLDAPVNVVASASAGGTVTDGTYYILVVAYNFAQTTTNGEDIPSYIHSPPSEIKTVVLGSGNNTFDISWDAVTGASSYRVYISTKASGEDRWSKTGVSNLTTSGFPTTNGTSVSISDETKMWGSGMDWFCYSYPLPYGLDKNTGRARLEIDGTMGTITMEDILAELPTGQYYIDASYHYKILANIVIMSGTTGTLTISNKMITTIKCDFLNSSGGTFTRNLNGVTWNLAGNYGSFALNEGDVLFRSTFKMGNSTNSLYRGTNGLLIDSNQASLIQVTKRLRFNNCTDNGYNSFTGVELGYVAGNIGRSSIGMVQMNMSGSTSTVYDLDGVSFGGRLQYDFWVSNAYRPLVKNCRIIKFSGYHLNLGRTQPTVDYQYFDCEWVGNTNNLPTVYYSYVSTDPNRDPTENNLKFWNSVKLTILDEDENTIENASISLTNVDDEELTDDTDSDGIVDFGYVYTNHMTSATPQVAGGTSTITSKSPFTLKIEKQGFETYVSVLDINNKIDKVITLKSAVDVMPVIGKGFAVKADPTNSTKDRDLLLPI